MARLFKITAVVLLTPPIGNTNTNYGLMLGESATSKLQAIGLFVSGNAPAGLQVNAWTWQGTNYYIGNPKNVAVANTYLTYLQFGYDGTNINFSYSNDGINFVTFYTSASNTFFTTAPDQIGFYMNAQNGTGPGFVRLVHWKQS